MNKNLIKSNNGKRTISVVEFDRIADSGFGEIDDFIDWSKAKRRGGPRPGAGRRPSGHVRMQILVSPSARDLAKRLAKSRRQSISSVFEDALNRLVSS